VGEKETEPFQFTFNGFLKVSFQGSRVTSNAGLILVRELDERLGPEGIIAAHPSDSRPRRPGPEGTQCTNSREALNGAQFRLSDQPQVRM
jgi:hypothetical protein